MLVCAALVVAAATLSYPTAAGAATSKDKRAQSPRAAKATKAAAKPTGKARSSTTRKAATASAAAAATTAVAARADSAPDDVIYGSREDVQRFADEVAVRHGINAAWLREHLAGARYKPVIARLVMPAPPGTAKNWAAYRDRFVEPVRLRAGREFWNQNEQWLAEAERRYGVPPEIVVGIIGVETIYGRQMGSFRVIDALATLAFDFPTGRRDRTPFFRDELEQFLLLCHERGLDPQQVRGSFAGAIGMPQFMPSNLRRLAVDFDQDGRIDLLQSRADVIGSVAHYLAQHGWQRGLPTHHEIAVPNLAADKAALLEPDILPTFSAQQMVDRGAWLPPAARQYDGKLALVELQNGDGAASHVAGTANFYAITRYNWSSYYAMAVITLGQAIKASR
jgi:membrane-bound lytic murein transglycosylase B